MIPARTLVSALVLAAVSIGLIRSGVLYTLFLLPVGISAYFLDSRRAAWITVAAAILGNGLTGLVLANIAGAGYGGLPWDLGFVSLALLLFGYVLSPPSFTPSLPRDSSTVRFLAGAGVLSLALMPLINAAAENPAVMSLFSEQAESLAALYRRSAGKDAVAASLSEQYITADFVIKSVIHVALRGGALASCVFLFFLNHQLAQLVFWLVKRKRTGNAVIAFRVNPMLIWLLSFAIIGVLAGLYGKAPVIEIAGWNILVLCAMLYLVQGAGILLHFISRPGIPPILRLIINMALILVVLSPGINLAMLGSLVLLGIAENWVPFRAAGINGSSSTPGM